MMGFTATLSTILFSIRTLSIEYYYAGCRIFIVMLKVVMLNAVAPLITVNRIFMGSQ